MVTKSRFAIGAAIILGVGCASRVTNETDEKVFNTAAQISLSGSFHIVYGDIERYFLIPDSSSTSVELRFSAQASGEKIPLLSFDRKRVSVSGRFASNSSSLLLVEQIKLLDRQIQ